MLPDALLDELPAVITGYYTWIAEQHLPKADRKETLRILRRHTAALPGQLGCPSRQRPFVHKWSRRFGADSDPRSVPMPNYIALTYTPDADWTRPAVLHEVGPRSASSGAATR